MALRNEHILAGFDSRNSAEVKSGTIRNIRSYACGAEHDAAIRRSVLQWCITAERGDTIPWLRLWQIVKPSDNVQGWLDRYADLSAIAQKESHGLLGELSSHLSQSFRPEAATGREITEIRDTTCAFASGASSTDAEMEQKPPESTRGGAAAGLAFVSARRRTNRPGSGSATGSGG